MDDASPSSGRDPGHAAGPGSDAIVYVVADSDAVRRSLVLLLRAEGFRVQAFASAAAFVADTAALRCRRGCLIVDHHLPGGMDGLDLVGRLPALDAAMPAIIINGVTTPALRRRATAAGAMAILAEPLISDALLDAVHEALEPAYADAQAAKAGDGQPA